MSLLDLAEILAGEALVTPSGCVDSITAMGLVADLWPPMEAAAASPMPALEAREPILART